MGDGNKIPLLILIQWSTDAGYLTGKRPPVQSQSSQDRPRCYSAGSHNERWWWEQLPGKLSPNPSSLSPSSARQRQQTGPKCGTAGAARSDSDQKGRVEAMQRYIIVSWRWQCEFPAVRTPAGLLQWWETGDEVRELGGWEFGCFLHQQDLCDGGKRVTK